MMSTTAANEEIYATNRAFEAAMDRGDAAGMAAVYTKEGQALPPNGEIVTGWTALQDFWQSVSNMGVRGVTLEQIELVPCGELFYEVGQAVLRSADDQVLDLAKYIVIWKQEGGQWKWHRDIWNSNISA
jgi:ketosteroid isomerase-like protein